MSFLSLITIFAYLIHAFYWYSYTILRKPLSPFSPWRWLALLGHGTLLYWSIDTPAGQNLSIPNVCSMVIWLMILLSSLHYWPKQRNFIDLLLHPLAALSLLALPFSDDPTRLHTAEHGSVGHILLSLSAMSIFIFASLQSLVLYSQSQLLKRYVSLAIRLRLPSMEQLEQELFQSLNLSFGFMTATLITGLSLSPTLFSSAVLPKSLAAIGAWSLLGSLLVGHYWFGWRGLKAVLLTTAGLLLLLIAYILSKSVLI